MLSSKILFVLDADILNVHHGVRRYFLSLADNVSKFFSVEFMLHSRTGEKHTYNEIVFSDCFVKNNGFTDNFLVGSSRREIISKITSNKHIGTSKRMSASASYSTSTIGDRVPDNYSLVIVAGPWIHIEKHQFSCPVACVGLDAIPNIYALYNIDDLGLQEFAWRHQYGFNYYDIIFSISEESKSQISHFTRETKKITVIPPFNPVGFSSVPDLKIQNKKNTIILAAPFDERKGLSLMPEFINNSKVDSIIIFGGVRCTINSLLNFFSDLKVNDIEWWSSVTTDKQIELYQRSRALLFPSFNEGLGLPVLEAHACNIPAVVSDIKPLNMLVREEFIIKNGITSNSNTLNHALSLPLSTTDFGLKDMDLTFTAFMETLISNSQETT